ncbi:hypothetical protein ACKUVQ_22045 [Mycobacterium seoulense]|uniref:hypothetical protein n=1 Tax=Mycobacterium seoulense TaxID=386911 RepID=UPI003CF6FDA5
MKAHMKTAVAVFGGISAVALALGFGGGDAGPAATATHSSSSPVATVATPATTHVATLAGCVSGLDC